MFKLVTIFLSNKNGIFLDCCKAECFCTALLYIIKKMLENLIVEKTQLLCFYFMFLYFHIILMVGGGGPGYLTPGYSTYLCRWYNMAGFVE